MLGMRVVESVKKYDVKYVESEKITVRQARKMSFMVSDTHAKITQRSLVKSSKMNADLLSDLIHKSRLCVN